MRFEDTCQASGTGGVRTEILITPREVPRSERQEREREEVDCDGDVDDEYDGGGDLPRGGFGSS